MQVRSKMTGDDPKHGGNGEEERESENKNKREQPIGETPTYGVFFDGGQGLHVRHRTRVGSRGRGKEYIDQTQGQGRYQGRLFEIPRCSVRR